MPVINLPRDTRGSELGSAIAGATKSLTDAYMQREAAVGVAEILQDPSIPDAKKGVKALEQFGDAGYDLFKKFQTTQVMDAQAKNLLASAGLDAMRAALEGEKLKTAPQMNQATLATQQAQPALIQSQTAENQATAASTRALIDPRVQALGAQTTEQKQATQQSADLFPSKLATAEQQPGLVQAQAGQAAGEALKSVPERDLLKLKVEQAGVALEQQRQLLTQGATTLDASLLAAGVDPNSAAGQLAKQNYINQPDPMKKWGDFSSVVEKEVGRLAKINEPAKLETEQRQLIRQADIQAASADKFLTAFERGGAQKTGWWDNVAPAKAFLEQIGVGTGDPQFVEMFNSSLQQVADTARSGSQFMSTGTVKLARDVTPSIAGTPLHAMMAANEVATRNIAALKAERGMMTAGQPKATIDESIKKWEALAKRTEIQSYTSTPWEVTVQRPDGGTFTRKLVMKDTPEPPPPGMAVEGGTVVGQPRAAGEPKSVVIFQGSQIDPLKFTRVIDANAQLDIGKGVKISGRQLLEDAQKYGVEPQALLEGLRASYGKTPEPTSARGATAPIPR